MQSGSESLAPGGPVIYISTLLTLNKDNLPWKKNRDTASHLGSEAEAHPFAGGKGDEKQLKNFKLLL